MDYLVEYPSVDKASAAQADATLKPDLAAGPTCYCPPPFSGLPEEQDLQINTTSS